jgi:hypothetical protein
MRSGLQSPPDFQFAQEAKQSPPFLSILHMPSVLIQILHMPRLLVFVQCSRHGIVSPDAGWRNRLPNLPYASLDRYLFPEITGICTGRTGHGVRE